MARTNNLTNFLTDVAGAIKEKTGDSAPIPASQFDTKIASITGGGNYQQKSLPINQNGNYTLLPDTGYDAMDSVSISVAVPTIDTSDANATASDIIKDKTAYVNGQKITGNIFVNTGSFLGMPTKTKTYSGALYPVLDINGPGIQAYRSATMTIVPDATTLTNLHITAGNIKKDVNIMGITGTYEGSGGGIDLTEGITFGYSTFAEIPSSIINANWTDITDMSGMFRGCGNLTEVPLIDTSTIISMYATFGECPSLDTVALLDTSDVTNMNAMFVNDTSLTTIPQFNTSSVENMAEMFTGCEALTTIPLLNTSNVTDMGSMFWNCTALESIPALNTSSAEYMNDMFGSCTSLEAIPSSLDTSSAVTTNNMFWGCTSLTSIPALDTSNDENMGAMFSGCTNLETIPVLDTSKALDMMYMFSECPSLSTTTLNNILRMCADADAYIEQGENLYLTMVGLTNSQIIACRELSNYQDCINAGWAESEEGDVYPDEEPEE